MRLSAYETELQKYVDADEVLIDQGHRSKSNPAIAEQFNGISCIFLDELAFSSDDERLLAFKHETAHVEYAGLYNENTPEWEVRRIEYHAHNYTVWKLVPFHDYSGTLMDGCLSQEEQALRWGIPTFYISMVHEVYNRTRWHEVQALMVEVRKKFYYD